MSIIATIVLWILAIVISTGKANFLIAGYNTASKEEKAKINEKALSKFMGKFLFILGLIQLIIPIARVIEISNFKLVLICTNVIFIIATIIGIIYINTSKKFQK